MAAPSGGGAGLAALPIALVVAQPDLSTAAVLCALTATMLVLGRIPLKVLVVFLVAAVLLLPFGNGGCTPTSRSGCMPS